MCVCVCVCVCTDVEYGRDEVGGWVDGESGSDSNIDKKQKKNKSSCDDELQ